MLTSLAVAKAAGAGAASDPGDAPRPPRGRPDGQGRGLGKALVKDALLRTAAAADIAGIRALLAHANDDEAQAWYEALGFEPSPIDPCHLFLLMKDLRAMLSG